MFCSGLVYCSKALTVPELNAAFSCHIFDEFARESAKLNEHVALRGVSGNSTERLSTTACMGHIPVTAGCFLRENVQCQLTLVEAI
jgi:hypothetical protein